MNIRNKNKKYIRYKTQVNGRSGCRLNNFILLLTKETSGHLLYQIKTTLITGGYMFTINTIEVI